MQFFAAPSPPAPGGGVPVRPPKPDSVATDFAAGSAFGTSCASPARGVQPSPVLDVPVPSPHAHFERR